MGAGARLEARRNRLRTASDEELLEQIGFKLNHFVIQFWHVNLLYHIDIRANDIVEFRKMNWCRSRASPRSGTGTWMYLLKLFEDLFSARNLEGAAVVHVESAHDTVIDDHRVPL
jgi:hypothetical protein